MSSALRRYIAGLDSARTLSLTVRFGGQEMDSLTLYIKKKATVRSMPPPHRAERDSARTVECDGKVKLRLKLSAGSYYARQFGSDASVLKMSPCI